MAHIAKELDDLATNTKAPMARKGNQFLSLTARKMNRSYWVVDIGASDHMTGSTTISKKFQGRDNDLTVLMADGTISLVKGKGSVCVAGLQLESVICAQSQMQSTICEQANQGNGLYCNIFFLNIVFFRTDPRGK